MAKSVTLSKNRQTLAPFEQALARAAHYANKSRASSTWRAYEKDAEIFRTWCQHYGRLFLPADTDTVAAFISAEADKGKAVSTIRRRLSAIRLLHIANEAPSPHASAKVTEVMKGIANAQRKRRVRRALPTLDTDIQILVDSIDIETIAGIRDRALLLVGFDSALRRSELVGITVEHIEERPLGLLITIPFSKTDQTGNTQQVAILAREQSDYCPVDALEHWITAAEIESGPIFRRVYKSGLIGDAALSDRSVASILKQRATLCGYNSKDVGLISGHSLRRGFITSAANAGESALTIIKQSRHKKVDSIMGYVDSVDLLESHPAKKLLYSK